MRYETLLVEIEPPLARITLNRPDRLNALGATMLHELTETAQALDRRPEVRVVIVRGAGRAFSAGADLKDPALVSSDTSAESDWILRREAGQRGLRMADAVEQMRAVTIVQLHGHVVGGAVVLASACDLRVAATDTIFSIPEIDLGIPLAWGGIPRLVREIGPALTKELVMTCRPFTAAEAKACGFLNRVVTGDRLEAEVEDLARSLVEKPPVPIVITKEHVNSVSRAMGTGSTAFADGDSLLGAVVHPASQQARSRYVEKTIAKKRR
jgi:enoyl-CoA hydratase/carnithine racemase